MKNAVIIILSVCLVALYSVHLVETHDLKRAYVEAKKQRALCEEHFDEVLFSLKFLNARIRKENK